MTVIALVEALRARGVTIEPRGDKLRIVPASAVTSEEVAALRAAKTDVLTLLTLLPPALPRLDAETIREVLGRDADDPHAVACVAWNVMNALSELEREIAMGTIRPVIRIVNARPLADWLSLDDVAHLLRVWGDRVRPRGGP